METKKVLITVKTYPIPSKKYDELVCTAGVEEDGSFVRLYPINFRDLPYDKQYKKYQWLQVEVERHRDDARKESYRPICDTIQMVGEPLLPKKGDWSERARYVMQQKSRSMEDLNDRKKADGTSLGIMKPRDVYGVIVKPNDEDWNPSFLAELAQMRIWEERKNTLQPPRKVPYKFFYKFACDDPRCKGNHQMSIHDWELGAFYWRMRDQGRSSDEAAEETRKQYYENICSIDTDTHFFVGTVSNHPNSWVVIGVWRPKIGSSKTRPQSSLILFDEDIAD